LGPLSEAVEKYQVYPARKVCKLVMEAAASEHPLDVLNYAQRHGCNDLAEKAAVLSIQTHLRLD
ncbi:hypothetical protein AMATHDRAFT_146318, partial [Amanita thiersii Skay4041]